MTASPATLKSHAATAAPSLPRGAAPFVRRHVGPSLTQQVEMLHDLGLASRDELIAQTIPEDIRIQDELDLPAPLAEGELLEELRRIAQENRTCRNFIGRGYYGTITPPVILRNILEDPGWYTQYTPYQSEISQGRLEILLNFQTMVGDLTGFPVAGASLLDEATAAAEAMAMCQRSGKGRTTFLADRWLHPQTLAVMETRARAAGIRLEVRDLGDSQVQISREVSGVIVQYPDTRGRVREWRPLVEKVQAAGARTVVATDLLALTMLEPPGAFGADIAVGSTQRFGMPMGGGGPHAAFLATTAAHARRTPGRVVGVSHDSSGRVGFRLALQTREQHIRRDRATSNICTAQVLPALVASAYAAWHGPEGLLRIARRVRALTLALRDGLSRLRYSTGGAPVFDTLTVETDDEETSRILAAAEARGINLGRQEGGGVGVSLDETATLDDVDAILAAFAGDREAPAAAGLLPEEGAETRLPPKLQRRSIFLDHEVFHVHRSEHEMLRYLHKLKERDLSLTTSMIPLGSCTMKLNATAEMLPVTWPEFADVHPFAPPEQQQGFARIAADLEAQLAEMTGFHAVSLQPNAGSQGEFTGLLMIRAYHESRGEGKRNVCLIPLSAHGTNPASAAMAGLQVVPVTTTEAGDIDVEDLGWKIEAYPDQIAALMITYPSTHGVFEERVREVCSMVREAGGLVYLDGANLNAQVGLTSPAEIGADVCHINLHKTFCIPHGGGGPGMGPVAATEELAPFLPGHPYGPQDPRRVGAISAAPWGSPAILPISWAYIRMMGAAGLKEASEVSILSANYMAHRLKSHYPLLYVGKQGRVAHEFILDCRPFKKTAGIEANDIAKRLMDYGFHAPTMSFPVAGTLMIEPTESESREELDRFCDAMIRIRAEIRDIEEGRADPERNPLRLAPHTARDVVSDAWDRPYSREAAAFPAPWLNAHKYWPPVGRVDNTRGDRNLICSCPDDWRSGEGHPHHDHHDPEHHSTP